MKKSTLVGLITLNVTTASVADETQKRANLKDLKSESKKSEKSILDSIYQDAGILPVDIEEASRGSGPSWIQSR